MVVAFVDPGRRRSPAGLGVCHPRFGRCYWSPLR